MFATVKYYKMDKKKLMSYWEQEISATLCEKITVLIIYEAIIS